VSSHTQPRRPHAAQRGSTPWHDWRATGSRAGYTCAHLVRAAVGAAVSALDGEAAGNTHAPDDDAGRRLLGLWAHGQVGVMGCCAAITGNHRRQPLQSAIAGKYHRQPSQAAITGSHHRHPSQATITGNHHRQPSQAAITGSHRGRWRRFIGNSAHEKPQACTSPPPLPQHTPFPP